MAFHHHHPGHHGHHHHHHDKYAVIRNMKSGFVLDAGDYEVKLQHYNGFPTQLWKIEPAEAGKFFIINKANGKALDIKGGASKGNTLITYGKHGGVNQQWYLNSDDTIVSPIHELAVDICENKYFAGNHLIAYPRHGADNQKFRVEYQ